MKEYSLYKKEYCVYPGEFSPSLAWNGCMDQLRSKSRHPVVTAKVNMTEYDNAFKIEVAIPGANREEVVIYAHENILTIMALHQDNEETAENKITIHEFETSRFERHILLPENADIEFVSAEYRQGILHLFIPKTSNPPAAEERQIIVY